MTVITISKEERTRCPQIEDEVSPFCEQIKYSPTSICFYPKPGFLVSLVVYLSEKKISYKLDFGT
jgi:hypothetical protein